MRNSLGIYSGVGPRICVLSAGWLGERREGLGRRVDGESGGSGGVETGVPKCRSTLAYGPNNQIL